MDRLELVNHSSADLADGIGQLHALGNYIHRQQLELIAAYDQKESWAEDGATSMHAWLTTALGCGHETAAEWMRVARALDELPHIAEAYEKGEISWDQARAATRLATPETDEAVADQARRFSAAQLRRMARRRRDISSEEDEDAYRSRRLQARWDLERRVLRLSGTLPAAEGSVVAKALEGIAVQAPPDPVTGGYEPYDVRCADALVQLASSHIAAQADAHRASVVVHVDADVLTGATGTAEIEGGVVISAEAARRLACDSRWLIVANGPDGLPVGIGRMSRKVPPWLSRELRRRDFGCRFPGCERTRWLAAHHLVPWGEGGPTDLDNLILLCGEHHRKVHEGGWTISGDPGGDLCFIRPDGRLVTTGPPALRAEIRDRILRAPGRAQPPESHSAPKNLESPTPTPAARPPP